MREVPPADDEVERGLTPAVVVLGITSLGTQIVLLREFLSVFFGNELVIGITLANWMLLTGVGSFVGRYLHPVKNLQLFLACSFILLGLLPPGTVFLLRLLRNIVFPSGSMIGIIEIYWSSLVLLAPYCLLGGLLFAFLARTLSSRFGRNLIATVYGWEAAGSLIGGIMFNVALIYLLQTFQSLLVLTGINGALSFLLLWRSMRPAARALLVPMAVGGLSVLLTVNLDHVTQGYLFKGQDVLYFKDTPYGNVTVTRQAEQLNVFEDNVLFFSTHDVIPKEESVHYAMVQHPAPKDVLLVSGGIAGTLDEILKYPVERVDYVEINPWLLDVGRTYMPSRHDGRVKVISTDPRLYVKDVREKYDVALINVAEPTTVQLNRFYTTEFVGELKSKLRGGGVVSMSLTSSADYLSVEARQVRSVIHNTLAASFRHVLIVPGMRDYFLASDAPLDIHVAEKTERRGISTTYVNRSYIDDDLLFERSQAIEKTLIRSAALNRDFEPVSFYRQQLLWLSQVAFNHWFLLGACVVLFAVVAARSDAVGFGMLCGGFVASAVEIVLLVAFQILYGYVFQLMGILITLFMAGLAAGALFGPRVITRGGMRGFVTVQVIISIYCVALPLLLALLAPLSTSVIVIHAAFFLLSFVAAFFIGTEFALASTLKHGTVSAVAAGLYSIDLVGSAIGALVVAAFLIPWLGVMKVCIAVAIVSLLGALVSVLNRDRYARKPVERSDGGRTNV